MATAARGGGGATNQHRRSTKGTCSSTTGAAATQAIPDLRILRDRLAGARRRLIERIDADWTDDRRFPDTGWSKMLADIHVAIQAVDEVIAEARP